MIPLIVTHRRLRIYLLVGLALARTCALAEVLLGAALAGAFGLAEVRLGAALAGASSASLRELPTYRLILCRLLHCSGSPHYLRGLPR